MASPGRPDQAASSTNLFSSIAAGIVIGLVDVVIALSLIALVFSGPWAVHLPAASAIALVGAAVVVLGIALISSIPEMIGTSQDTTAAVLAIAAASVATSIDPASQHGFFTLVLIMMVSGICMGGLFLLLGALRLGDLIRYMPFPVIGGFLAGTGFLISIGSLGIMTNLSLSVGNLLELVDVAAAAKWLPGVALVALLMYLTRGTPHPLVVPGTLVGAVVAFYLVSGAVGTSPEELQAGGWLLGPFPRTELWQPWPLEAVTRGDWSMVVTQAGNIATLTLVGLIAMLLNATGVELSMGRDGDFNRELVAAGGANLAGAVFAAIPGYQALSLTVLSQRLGARGRLAGVVTAMSCAGAMFLAALVLNWVPRFLLGGLLLLLGFSFVKEWLLGAWSRLPRAEFVVVMSIFLVIVFVDLIAGAALGLLLSILLFVVSYSRSEVVKHELSGATLRSNVERPLQHLELLRKNGESIYVVELQGFLFFGTAHQVSEKIRTRLDDSSRARVLAAVVDFNHVTGVDASAVASIARIQRLATSRESALVFTGLSEQMQKRLERENVRPGEAFVILDSLDSGLEWCEHLLLQDLGALKAPSASPPLPPELAELEPYLERIELAPGHTVMEAGEMSRDVYFLQSGRLAAYVSGDVPGRIRSMGPGTIFGEVGAYLDAPRTATVVAEEPCVVLRVAIEQLERTSPATAIAFHRMVASTMAQRLRDNVQLIGALRR